MRAVAPALGLHLADLPVGATQPHPVAVHESHLAPSIHDLLDALPARHLDPHALLAAGLGMATVGVVEDEGLLEDEVDDRRAGQLRHEGLDGNPGIGREGCQWQQQHGRQRSEAAAHAFVIRGRRGVSQRASAGEDRV